ncbi:hypothetical protein HIM_02123 [Hirsutella minnesotensis 3608]|nr:hypothetical protein HIM_02123 [Hirsutella minnesotensis 3608]
MYLRGLRSTPGRRPWGRLERTLRLHWRLIVGLATVALVESLLHVQSFAITRPTTNPDMPFHVGCQDPILNGTARANATLVMLARNSEAQGAIASVRSVQKRFNRHFGYPWIFLNDEPWTSEFEATVRAAVEEGGGGAKASFETIPAHMWGYPSWVDRSKAGQDMREMEERGIKYAGKESYHHMCRFNSGFFFDHPAVRRYKWYWRVEPDVSFTCDITYDPFVEMERNGKRYGFTMALWEVPETAPSLFRKISEYKTRKGLAASALWTAMMDPSYLPWPLRRLRQWWPNRDEHGDAWNLCHFWSNFEIADMDWYRGRDYRDLFDHLDQEGGFYHERWGDAPVHSLAAALLLRPEQVHHFSDFGYVHDSLQYCTHGPTVDGLRRGEPMPRLGGRNLDSIQGQQLGCRCKCDGSAGIIQPTCLNRIRRAVTI